MSAPTEHAPATSEQAPAATEHAPVAAELVPAAAEHGAPATVGPAADEPSASGEDGGGNGQPKGRASAAWRAGGFSKLGRSAPPASLSDVVSLASQELLSVLAKALQAIGQDDASDGINAKALCAELGSLYIRTPDQLRQALEVPEVLEQVRLVLKGMLIIAVRAELKRDEHGAQWRKVAVRGQAAVKLPSPLRRTLEIVRADITQLSAIDQITQTFRGIHTLLELELWTTLLGAPRSLAHNPPHEPLRGQRASSSSCASPKARTTRTS